MPPFSALLPKNDFITLKIRSSPVNVALALEIRYNVKTDVLTDNMYNYSHQRCDIASFQYVIKHITSFA